MFGIAAQFSFQSVILRVRIWLFYFLMVVSFFALLRLIFWIVSVRIHDVSALSGSQEIFSAQEPRLWESSQEIRTKETPSVSQVGMDSTQREGKNTSLFAENLKEKREIESLIFSPLQVEFSGNLLLSGRAPRGSEVLLYSEGIQLSRTVANDQEEWVLELSKSFKRGVSTIDLVFKRAEKPTQSVTRSLLLIVPEDSRAWILTREKSGDWSLSGSDRITDSFGGKYFSREAEIVWIYSLLEADDTLDSRFSILVEWDREDKDRQMLLSGHYFKGGIARIFYNQRHISDVTLDSSGDWALRSGDISGAPIRDIRVEYLHESSKDLYFQFGQKSQKRDSRENSGLLLQEPSSIKSSASHR